MNRKAGNESECVVKYCLFRYSAAPFPVLSLVCISICSPDDEDEDDDDVLLCLYNLAECKQLRCSLYLLVRMHSAL